MGSKTKRQTMGKMTRERELKERRELKQKKREEKKHAAADNGASGEVSAPGPDEVAPSADVPPGGVDA